jgi:hypothetical protein
MRKVISLTILLLVTIVTFGQSKWDGFFKPVSYSTPALRSVIQRPATSVWLFRPTVELSAVQFTWNKELKQFDSNAFSSVGMGLGYQHYIDVNGEPYNNFGVNLLVLMNTSTSEDPASISLAGTVNALKFVSLGAGYNTGQKVFFFLTGVTHNF